MALGDFITGGAALADVPLAGQDEGGIFPPPPPIEPPEGVTGHTLAEHVFTLASYLPKGEVWDSAFVTGSNFNMLLFGLAGGLLDLEGFLIVYNSQFIPIDTNDFIEDWERVLGIPDGIFPGPSEDNRETRRQHILVKLASLGVTTVADFEAIPPLLGIGGVTVQPGVDAGFTPIADARFTIVVDLSAGKQIFPLVFPIPFGALENQIIQDLFEVLRPANCQLDFL